MEEPENNTIEILPEEPRDTTITLQRIRERFNNHACAPSQFSDWEFSNIGNAIRNSQVKEHRRR